MLYLDTIQNSRARSELLGLKSWSKNSLRKAESVFVDSDLNIDTSTLDSFSDLITGFVDGFLADPNTDSECSTAITAVLEESKAIVELLKKVYIPENIASLLGASDKYMVFLAGVNLNCKFDGVITQFTTEWKQNLSTMAARIVGGMAFQYPKYFKEFKNAVSKYDRWNPIAKLLSDALGFKL